MERTPTVRKELSKNFTNYSFCNIPANDVRTKPARSELAETGGLVDRNDKLKKEFTDDLGRIFRELNDCFEKDG